MELYISSVLGISAITFIFGFFSIRAKSEGSQQLMFFMMSIGIALLLMGFVNNFITSTMIETAYIVMVFIFWICLFYVSVTMLQNLIRKMNPEEEEDDVIWAT